ncbi:hypothetical protein BO85DRAFT_61785 [Aspergillus piperis CBS 112811]|uniref:Uncharacterized protein n=1 Tax=Aspergillus piperis CBS 112811 TaxID=1448313 RepID=A0A8G1R0W2_9EURO|nr:hypothetical protein BO85DRAFT_61785 [Aspergillus piperis CBS 112811]RAH56219.1 hypothetical protein BO85DRAFT_61785 [Aspergillus piperis CBS 112811]
MCQLRRAKPVNEMQMRLPRGRLFRVILRRSIISSMDWIKVSCNHNPSRALTARKSNHHPKTRSQIHGHSSLAKADVVLGYVCLFYQTRTSQVTEASIPRYCPWLQALGGSLDLGVIACDEFASEYNTPRCMERRGRYGAMRAYRPPFQERSMVLL